MVLVKAGRDQIQIELEFCLCHEGKRGPGFQI